MFADGLNWKKSCMTTLGHVETNENRFAEAVSNSLQRKYMLYVILLKAMLSKLLSSYSRMVGFSGGPNDSDEPEAFDSEDEESEVSDYNDDATGVDFVDRAGC